MNIKSPQDLVGKFFVTSEGERVVVERMGAEDASLPARAIVRRVEGPKAGTRFSRLVSGLEPVGVETSV